MANIPESDDPLWPAFVDYDRGNGISLECRADWGEWWKTFEAGANAQIDLEEKEE